MTLTGVTTTTTTQPPDWSQQAEEITCPLCGYNLRGLTEPRCPECGHQFDWPTLLDPTQRTHPYLFEHQPKRNVKSFIQTTLHALLPRRFWRSLHPARKSHLRRLILFWLISAVVVCLPVSGEMLRWVQMDMAYRRTVRASALAQINADPNGKEVIIKDYGSVRNWLDAVYPLGTRVDYYWDQWRHDPFTFGGSILSLIYLAWPWAAFFILMLFRASMRRAKIAPSHVLRCTIYSAHSGLPLLAAAAIVAIVWGRFYVPWLWLAAPYAWWIALAILWGGVTYGLIRAYRLYLRFDHSVGVVLAVQMIFFLVVLQILVLILPFDQVKDLVIVR